MVFGSAKCASLCVAASGISSVIPLLLFPRSPFCYSSSLPQLLRLNQSGYLPMATTVYLPNALSSAFSSQADRLFSARNVTELLFQFDFRGDLPGDGLRRPAWIGNSLGFGNMRDFNANGKATTFSLHASSVAVSFPIRVRFYMFGVFATWWWIDLNFPVVIYSFVLKSWSMDEICVEIWNSFYTSIRPHSVQHLFGDFDFIPLAEFNCCCCLYFLFLPFYVIFKFFL